MRCACFSSIQWCCNVTIHNEKHLFLNQNDQENKEKTIYSIKTSIKIRIFSNKRERREEEKETEREKNLKPYEKCFSRIIGQYPIKEWMFCVCVCVCFIQTYHDNEVKRVDLQFIGDSKKND